MENSIRLNFGDHVKCRWCKGRGENYRGHRGWIRCPYCNGRGVIGHSLERYYMGELVLNVRCRTKVEDKDGTLRELKEVFAWPYEMDIRARSVEQNHETLNASSVGDTVRWEYQGYTFITEVLEKREPEAVEI